MYYIFRSGAVQEIQWPDAEERAVHCNFIQYWGHPEFPRIAYIADGTMVNIRNPAKVQQYKRKIP